VKDIRKSWFWLHYPSRWQKNHTLQVIPTRTTWL